MTGSYSTYSSVARKVDNTDDIYPNYVNFADLPGTNAEWCFKIRGEAGGVASGDPYYWGPRSKAYCVARSGGGNGVFVASDRNGNVNFWVWNYSGAQITNVVLMTTGGTVICSLGNINNGASKNCSSSIGGPGYLNVYYNGSWVPLDTIGYDG